MDQVLVHRWKRKLSEATQWILLDLMKEDVLCLCECLSPHGGIEQNDPNFLRNLAEMIDAHDWLAAEPSTDRSPWSSVQWMKYLRTNFDDTNRMEEEPDVREALTQAIYAMKSVHKK